MDDLNGKAARVAASASAASVAIASDRTGGDPRSRARSDAGDRLLCAAFIVVSSVGMLYLVEMAAACAGFELFHAR